MALKHTAPAGLVFLLACVFVVRPYNNWPPIRSDGVGYHVWVNGLLAADLSFCAYRPLLETVDALGAVDERRLVCGIKYPPGVALLQLAFVSPWADPTLRDGFAREVHAIVLALGSVLLLVTAAFSYLALRRLDLSPTLSQAVVGAFLFGTGLFHYATYDASFSHIYSASGIALLLWLLLRARERGWGPAMLGLFGLAVFWLYTVRQTNGLLTLLVAALAAADADRRDARRVGAMWGAATVLALLLQVAYNQYVTGAFTLFSYGRESFASWGGHFGDVLFSYERGLGTYYPLMIVAMVSAAFSRERLLGCAFAVAILAYAFLYGSWHSWMLGHGMGHRGFVELAPMGMLVFGSALRDAPASRRLCGFGIAGLCVYVTLQVMVGYWRGTYPFAGADSAVYWQHLLHPTGIQVALTAIALAAVVAWTRAATRPPVRPATPPTRVAPRPPARRTSGAR